jgi:hypothetical protein
MSVASIQRIHVNKLDVAMRQLKTSIRLWFHDTDPVSAHSLAYAAYTVLDDVTKARNPNRPALLFDSPHVTEADRKLINYVFKRTANFCKHADRDPYAKLNFSPDETRVILSFAIFILECEGERLSAEIIAFQAWLFMNNPSLISQRGSKIFTESFLVEYAEVLTYPKGEFFDLLCAALKEGGA